MPVPFEIVARQITLEEPTRARLEKLVAKLETFDPQDAARRRRGDVKRHAAPVGSHG